MLAKKFTLVVDDAWLREILKHWEYVEAGEVFQLLDEEDVELCDDCQVYLTEDGEVVMDVFKDPNAKQYCLNCTEGGHYE